MTTATDSSPVLAAHRHIAAAAILIQESRGDSVEGTVRVYALLLDLLAGAQVALGRLAGPDQRLSVEEQRQ